MTKISKILLLFLLASQQIALQQAFAQSIDDRAEAHAKKAIERSSSTKILEVEKMLATEMKNFASSEEKHPWIKDGNPKGVNPNSRKNYKEDSKNTWDAPSFANETWSCFEPQLIGYGHCDQPPVTADFPLAIACAAHCCLEELIPYIPFLLPDAQGDYFGPPGGRGGGGKIDYYEVIQFWYPENQAAINNYGRMRVNPMEMSGIRNNEFLRDTLLRNKNKPEQSNPENITKELDKSLNSKRNKVKDYAEPGIRKEPVRGQTQDRTNEEDQFHAHVYRTHTSSIFGDNKPNNRAGFARNPRSIYDALEPDTKTKYQLNIWTEYDYFDYLTSVNSASFSIVGDEHNRSQNFMKALFPEGGENILLQGPWYLTKGAAAHRVGKSPLYAGLKDIAGIKPHSNVFLDEINYIRSGLELYPLTLSFAGLARPELSLRAVAARKAFEIAGNKILAAKFPGGQKSRMNTFTISAIDHSEEIDKVQRVYPLNPDGKPQECYRSQRIPNMLDQTEDPWTAKQFPSDLMGYVKQDNHDSAHVYWNKRVACTCKWDANPGGFGSQEWGWIPDGLGPGRGTGDRIYGKLENILCSYPPGAVPSAFAGKQVPPCSPSVGGAPIPITVPAISLTIPGFSIPTPQGILSAAPFSATIPSFSSIASGLGGNFSIPSFSSVIPSLSIPNVTLGGLPIPNISLPNIPINIPNISLPNFSPANFANNFTIPQLTLPNVPFSVPGVPGNFSLPSTTIQNIQGSIPQVPRGGLNFKTNAPTQKYYQGLDDKVGR